MNAIEIKGLKKSYKGFSLDGLDLCLPQGCIMGLIGENGAGKSTTIKLILDIIKKDGGTVTLFGERDGDLRLQKEDIGVVLDEIGLPGCLNVKQVNNVMKNIFKNWDEEKYFSYIKRFALSEKKMNGKFSRGMRMKLCIAVALSHNARLLILDEATSGLDPVIRDEILDIFIEFTRDERNSILISSHIVSDLEKICDYIAFLHKGKLMLCEEKDALYERYGIILTNEAELAQIAEDAVIGKKVNPYGVEAIVKRDHIPAGIKALRIDIEQLFIFMIKGENSK